MLNNLRNKVFVFSKVTLGSYFHGLTQGAINTPNSNTFWWNQSSPFISCLSHLKNTASRRQPCKAGLSKVFKHFPDRTQGCLVFCTQQRIIYIPHVTLPVSAILWHHFPASKQLGVIPGWEHRVGVTVWRCCWHAPGASSADRDRAPALPGGPATTTSSSNSVAIPSPFFFWAETR